MARALLPKGRHNFGPVVLEDFSNGTVGQNPAGWTLTDSGGLPGSTLKVSSDFPHPLTESGKWVKITTVVTAGGQRGFPAMNKSVAWDLSQAESICVPVYITGGPAGATGLSDPNYLAMMNTNPNFSFQLTSNGAFVDCKNCAMNASATKRTFIEGHNYITIKLSELTNIGTGAINWAAVNGIQIRLQGLLTDGISFQVYVGGVVKNARQSPCVILGFDNSLLSPWTQYQVWKAANPRRPDIPIMYYHNIDSIDSDGSHLTTADLASIVAAGGEHALHSGPPLGSVAWDLEAMGAIEDSIRSGAAFLSRLGYTSGIRHLAYPLGRFGRQAGVARSKEEMRSACRRAGILTGRTIQPNNTGSYASAAAAQSNNCLLTGAPTDPYMLNCYGIDTDQMRDQGARPLYFDYIDFVVANGGMLELYSHWVIDTTQSLTRIGITEFQNLLDYLDKYRRQGALDVLTKSQWYKSLETRRMVRP